MHDHVPLLCVVALSHRMDLHSHNLRRGRMGRDTHSRNRPNHRSENYSFIYLTIAHDI